MARQQLEDPVDEETAVSPTFAHGETGRNNWGVRQTTQPRVPV